MHALTKVEIVDFMYRGLMYTLIDGTNEVVAETVSYNGFPLGIPPYPLPAGPKGCCEEMPWTAINSQDMQGVVCNQNSYIQGTIGLHEEQFVQNGGYFG
eukprot:CAMPEP_0174264264 /NCGR_PEP_ID=MMETSP0439-20130205/21893_1 /TAXON_ID=0 /ORGANISM="Stereomyxa ramosa, Strain Chinc5" /LENGTH=98 /DNA_ID=CAMNT_0015350057 /DNA_START=505 /DNA_END=798 /DNA_ORIENTATION=-